MVRTDAMLKSSRKSGRELVDCSWDSSDISKATIKVFKMPNDAIKFIEEENMVHVVANYAANSRKNLCWTPCAAIALI